MLESDILGRSVSYFVVSTHRLAKLKFCAVAWSHCTIIVFTLDFQPLDRKIIGFTMVWRAKCRQMTICLMVFKPQVAEIQFLQIVWRVWRRKKTVFTLVFKHWIAKTNNDSVSWNSTICAMGFEALGSRKYSPCNSFRALGSESHSFTRVLEPRGCQPAVFRMVSELKGCT